jgi:hypothetical protein
MSTSHGCQVGGEIEKVSRKAGASSAACFIAGYQPLPCCSSACRTGTTRMLNTSVSLLSVDMFAWGT